MSKVHTVSIWNAPPFVRERFKLLLKQAERKYGSDPKTCWWWEMKLNAQGYGEWKWFDPLTKKMHGSGAHKISLELVLGRPLAAGMVAGHQCPVENWATPLNPDRRCFRGSHLGEMSQSENMKEWADARRAAGLWDATVPNIEDGNYHKSLHEVKMDGLMPKIAELRARGYKWVAIEGEIGHRICMSRRKRIG